MPRACAVCTSGKREEIDRLLASGEGVKRRIAARLGISEGSVRRHEARHLDPRLIAAQERSLEAEAMTARGNIVEAVNDLKAKLKAYDGVRDDQWLEFMDRMIRANEQFAKINKELGADQVTTFLIELGARSQDEVKARLALSSGMDNLAPEEAQSEAIATLKTVWRMNPSFRHDAMRELGEASFAEVVTNGTNGAPRKALGPSEGP